MHESYTGPAGRLPGLQASGMGVPPPEPKSNSEVLLGLRS